MIQFIRCVTQACDELGVAYRFHDTNKNFVELLLQSPYYFVNYATPFCRADLARIFKDKEFTYNLLGEALQVPKTIGFLDPNCRDDYQGYVTVKSYDQIVEKILQEFEFPIVLKRNKGTRGINVFLCRHREELESAVKTIFKRDSPYYDYVAVAQQFVAIAKEYRVVLFGSEILLTYEKSIENATFTGNLSPLHWEKSRAIHIQDSETLDRFRTFLKPLYDRVEVGFLGIDLAMDQSGKLWTIEINTQPNFGYFSRDNGTEPVVSMLKTMIQTLMETKTPSHLSQP